MPQSNEVVNLWLYFDEWSRCISSTYQKDSLYRFGKFDSCSAQYADLKTAVSAKMKSDKEEAIRMEAATHYRKNLGSSPAASPTAGVIWELRIQRVGMSKKIDLVITSQCVSMSLRPFWLVCTYESNFGTTRRLCLFNGMIGRAEATCRGIDWKANTNSQKPYCSCDILSLNTVFQLYKLRTNPSARQILATLQLLKAMLQYYSGTTLRCGKELTVIYKEIQHSTLDYSYQC